MAALLAQPGDLETLLDTTLSTAKAELLLRLATGAVQKAAGQQLVQVSGDTFELSGTTDSWLKLPQRPVTAVSLVKIDSVTIAEGTADGNYERRGNRLWRRCGWSDDPYRPSKVEGVYDHGLPENADALQLARSVTLMLAAQVYANPKGATGFSIDDYREQYSQQAIATLVGQVPDQVAKALRHAYGSRAGLVRIG